jgi:hypothetical protein
MTWSFLAHRPQPKTGPPPGHLRHKTTEPTAPAACAHCRPTTAARRSGPREHGRQAARSKRSRTGGRRGNNASQPRPRRRSRRLDPRKETPHGSGIPRARRVSGWRGWVAGDWTVAARCGLCHQYLRERGLLTLADPEPGSMAQAALIESGYARSGRQRHRELIVLLTTITEPTAARADELAAAHHER